MKFYELYLIWYKFSVLAKMHPLPLFPLIPLFGMRIEPPFVCGNAAFTYEK